LDLQNNISVNSGASPLVQGVIEIYFIASTDSLSGITAYSINLDNKMVGFTQTRSIKLNQYTNGSVVILGTDSNVGESILSGYQSNLQCDNIEITFSTNTITIEDDSCSLYISTIMPNYSILTSSNIAIYMSSYRGVLDGIGVYVKQINSEARYETGTYTSQNI